MPDLPDALQRHIFYYCNFVQVHTTDIQLLDNEFAQIQQAYTWLITQTNSELAKQLIRFVENIASYLQTRTLHAVLLNYCESGLQAAKQLGVSPGSMLLLRGKAFWSMGDWDKALADVQAAIQATQDTDLQVYNRAMLTLGSFQLNRGDYRLALKTLSVAQGLSENLSDIDGIATAKSDIAAYFLNRNELDVALSLYKEVDALRRKVDPRGPSDHTLLMLGVVQRRLKHYEEAIKYLTELYQRARERKISSAEATALHHLAWVYFEQKDLGKAYELGLSAKTIYEEIQDPRGSSDADEQLGRIALAKRDYPFAQAYLERSLKIRQKLGNQQGFASSLRHLAQVEFDQGHLVTGLRSFWQSVAIYKKIGALSYQSLANIIADLINESIDNRRG